MTPAPSVGPYRKLVEACFAPLTIGRCELLRGGWDHVMLLVDGEWIYRIPRRPEGGARLRKEAALLPQLGPTLPLRVPRFERVWRGETPPTIIVAYRKLPGRPLPRAAFVASRRAETAAAVGGFLTALHRFPVRRAASLGVPGGGPGVWRREHEGIIAWIRREAFPLLTSRERRWAMDLCEGFLADASNFRFHPVLLHRDLGKEHVLQDPASHRLTGVLDWGDASIGDPALDFTGLLADFGEAAARSVLRAYRGRKDAGMLGRARFYAALIPFHELRFGREFGHAASSRRALRRLRAHAIAK